MDQRPAVSVARHHEARCHILAQQRDILGMQAVANGQGAACVVAVRRISKRGVGAEADAREINAARALPFATALGDPVTGGSTTRVPPVAFFDSVHAAFV